MEDSGSVPPQPPRMARRFAVYRHQLIGIPLLLLLPVLAVSGVFGVSSESRSVRGDAVSVVVEHPSRLRYKMFDTLRIEVRNTSGRARTVTVAVDRSYLDRFSGVTFVPAVEAITDAAYVLRLEIPADEVRVATATLRAEDFGRPSGAVRVRSGASEWTVPVTTVSFP